MPEEETKPKPAQPPEASQPPESDAVRHRPILDSIEENTANPPKRDSCENRGF